MDIPFILKDISANHLDISGLKRQLNSIISKGVEINLYFKGHSFLVHHFSTERKPLLSVYHKDGYQVDLRLNQLEYLKVTDVLNRQRSFIYTYTDVRDGKTRLECLFRTWDNPSTTVTPYYIIIPESQVKVYDLVLDLKTNVKKSSKLELDLFPIFGKNDTEYFSINRKFEIKNSQIIQFLKDVPGDIQEDFPHYHPLVFSSEKL